MNPAELYPTQQYPAQLYPAQQYPAQLYPAQQYPAQQYPAQQYPAQQYPAQQYPAQQYPAQQQPPPNAPEFGGSSPIGLVVILALFVVTFFLVRSMNKHLKKVPASFDRSGEGPAEQSSDTPGGTTPEGDPEDGPKTTTAQ